jgi:magnesium-transporting ATPase (P-type)
VLHTDVFARTSPEHKLRLVQALQSCGLTVAMTGDGVNDAPALKRADAGVAMGLRGSEAAREAAELVLADDNFASIVAAIREGRTVYENLKKVISWTLPTNGGEALTLIVALLAGLPLPVTPVQILWVNLITATTLGLALAFEPSEAEVMRQPPRKRDEPLLTARLVWQILLVSLLVVCCVFGVYWIAIERGHPVELARTLVLNMLVVTEIAYLFSIRNRHASSLSLPALRGTLAVWTAVALVVLAQLAVTFMPLLQAVFGTRSLPLAEALLLAVFGLAFFVAVEAEKAWRMRAGSP